MHCRIHHGKAQVLVHALQNPSEVIAEAVAEHDAQDQQHTGEQQERGAQREAGVLAKFLHRHELGRIEAKQACLQSRERFAKEDLVGEQIEANERRRELQQHGDARERREDQKVAELRQQVTARAPKRRGEAEGLRGRRWRRRCALRVAVAQAASAYATP